MARTRVSSCCAGVLRRSLLTPSSVRTTTGTPSQASGAIWRQTTPTTGVSRSLSAHCATDRRRKMKLVFVYWGYENAGSMLDLRGYARAAKSMGHEAIVYGPPNPAFGLDYSKDLSGADAVIFVFEWTTDLQFGDRLDW